jgi:hypothetical protein
MPEHPRSLTRQVNALEMQVMSHHRNLKAVEAGFKRKITAGMVSPGSLLAAVGVGVVMEQTNHHRGWSPATVVAAADASIRLLLWFTSPLQAASENSTQESSHDFAR